MHRMFNVVRMRVLCALSCSPSFLPAHPPFVRFLFACAIISGACRTHSSTVQVVIFFFRECLSRNTVLDGGTAHVVVAFIIFFFFLVWFRLVFFYSKGSNRATVALPWLFFFVPLICKHQFIDVCPCESVLKIFPNITVKYAKGKGGRDKGEMERPREFMFVHIAMYYMQTPNHHPSTHSYRNQHIFYIYIKIQSNQMHTQ